jgi:hypothetical protein
MEDHVVPLFESIMYGTPVLLDTLKGTIMEFGFDDGPAKGMEREYRKGAREQPAEEVLRGYIDKFRRCDLIAVEQRSGPVIMTDEDPEVCCCDCSFLLSKTLFK